MPRRRDDAELETEVQFNLICRQGKTGFERRRHVSSAVGRFPKTIAVVHTQQTLVTADGSRQVVRVTIAGDDAFALRSQYDAIARHLMQQPGITVTGRNCNVADLHPEDEG